MISRAVLQAPITPFTVLFCEVIAHPDSADEDLRFLQKYTNVLEELSSFSDGLTKIHRLCDIFCKVAVLYVRSKTNNGPNLYPEGQGFAPSEDIDNYLAGIGLAYSNQSSLGDAEMLDEWYQGHATLMDFLDRGIT